VNYNAEEASIYQQEKNFKKLSNPITYWRNYADPEMEALPKVAKSVFNNILCSSSVCEQSFRDHEYIYTLYSNKRLRMNVGQLQKLVFLFSNRRL
jgi:hypothetical protein